jgi:transposase
MRDAVGAKQVLATLGTDAPGVTKIWVDRGYRGELADWVKQETGATLQVVARPRTRGWVSAAAPPSDPLPVPASFQVLPRRWVVERTFGWLGRSRRLSKAYEGLPRTEEMWITMAMCRLMLRRLASS